MKTEPVNIPAFRDLGNPACNRNPPEHIALGSITLCVAKKQSGKPVHHKPSVPAQTGRVHAPCNLDRGHSFQQPEDARKLRHTP